MRTATELDWLDRIAETEYAKSLDPAYARACRFGVFLSDPRFPDRYNANQLLRVRCNPRDFRDLIAEVEGLYEGLGLPFYKVSGHDPETWEHLTAFLDEESWILQTDSMKLLAAPSGRRRVSNLSIRAVEPNSPDLESLFTTGGALDRGFELTRTRYPYLGGEYLVGYAGRDPVCTSGWYVRRGVARFRYVYTVPEARGRGYAGTLIQHICELSAVRSQEAIAIFVTEKGPEALYEKLGFRTRGVFYEARKELTVTKSVSAARRCDEKTGTGEF